MREKNASGRIKVNNMTDQTKNLKLSVKEKGEQLISMFRKEQSRNSAIEYGQSEAHPEFIDVYMYNANGNNLSSIRGMEGVRLIAVQMCDNSSCTVLKFKGQEFHVYFYFRKRDDLAYKSLQRIEAEIAAKQAAEAQ